MGAIVTAEWMYSVGEVGGSEGCGRTTGEAVATGGSSTKSGYGMPSARRMPLKNRPKQRDCRRCLSLRLGNAVVKETPVRLLRPGV